MYTTYEYKKEKNIHVSLVAPEPVLSWGIYDMFRLPFVMPQSGDAPPGVEESKFDTEGLKGVGKGVGNWQPPAVVGPYRHLSRKM